MIEFDIPQFSFKRRMFFVLDEHQKANDLLYDSIHYPISFITSPFDCLNSHIGIDGHFTYKLDRVLQYFNYPEMISYEDVLKIQELFTFDSQIINSKAFGLHLFKDQKERDDFIMKFPFVVLHKPPEMDSINNTLSVLIDGPISFSYYWALRFLSNRKENGREIDFSLPASFEKVRKLSK